MNDVNETQVGGTHYKNSSRVQHWDLVADLPYLEGYATKYLVRLWKSAKSTTTEDLEKSRHITLKIINEFELRGRSLNPAHRVTPIEAEIFCNANKMNSALQRIAFHRLCSWENKTDLLEALSCIEQMLSTEKNKAPRIDKTGQTRPFGYDPNEEEGR